MNILLHTRRIAIVTAITIILVGCSNHYGARQEGDFWLTWSKETRLAYIAGYVYGMQDGFSKGCDGGIKATKEQIMGAEFENDSKHCWSSFPISSRDSADFIKPITDFYAAYPSQRYVRISVLLVSLHAGKTIEQMHEQFPNK